MSTVETRYCYRHPDRETGLSCSECGRPICEDCMTVAPVGLRCPEHAGASRRTSVRASRGGVAARPSLRAPALPMRRTTALVTRILIGLNVAVYLVTVVQGGGINSPGGSLFDKWLLYGPYVARGDWWRLITAAFLHEGILHIGFNMLALWFVGAPVEEYLGRVRYLLVYLVSGLAGSAGALFQSPHVPTVGASGAIFGILGALLVIEYQVTGRLMGTAMTWIVLNLAISFAVPGISWGGHVGGLIAGILCTLGFARFGRGHPAYSPLGVATLSIPVLVGVLSVVAAYWRVRGMA
ncbi:MAG TPA: rhomboid family intramembrane serine protease [Gaiellaceae bacterium]|nr:rhomboid family intramembrane serine protease [Gaiellaceae bacterium]